MFSKHSFNTLLMYNSNNSQSVQIAFRRGFKNCKLSKRQTSLPSICKYYNTNHSNNALPAAAVAATSNGPFHHVDSFSFNTMHQKQSNNQHILHQQHDQQQVADYHQTMHILRELNQIRHHNYELNKKINHLQEFVHVREKTNASLSSWMDTNPFKFGLLCGSVVFVLIALRMDLEKNRKKVKELKEELSKLSIRRRFGNQ